MRLSAPARIRLDLAYLGTAFEGWQVQVAGRTGRRPRTVQGVLMEALEALYGIPVVVHGASRTDAGVHAEGQCAHADLPAGAPDIPADGLRRGLNALLPEDVRILAAAPSPGGWHARYSALGKLYRYRIRRAEVLPPHAGLVEALERRSLDLAAIRAAAGRLEGRRDFAPFSVTGSAPRTTVRTLVRLEVAEEGEVLVVSALGDGFLRGMVRRLVGTLLEVGRGRTPWQHVLERPGPPAPARGLTLSRVFYRREVRGRDRMIGSDRPERGRPDSA